jgi:hypothetical protein
MTGCGTAPGGYETPRPAVLNTGSSGMSTPSLSRVDERGGFSADHSGLGLLNRGEHAFTEIQAFALPHAPAEGKPELVHLNGELA